MQPARGRAARSTRRACASRTSSSDRGARPRAHRGVNRVDAAVADRPLARSAGSAALAARAARLRQASACRSTAASSLALNHFSWIDIPLLRRSRARATRTSSRRSEAHDDPGLGQFIRMFGAFAVRRGESDREAVRRMREVVRDGNVARRLRRGDAAALRRSGRGAAGRRDGRAPGGRAGRLRRDPRLAELEGRQLRARHGRVERADALRRPAARREGLPRGVGRRSSAEIRRLWEWLRDMHAAGRPRNAVPPRAPERLRAPVTLP